MALLLTATVGLAGCSSGETSDWGSVLEMAKQYWSGPPAVSLQQAAAIPYATIGVRLGDSAQAMLVLASNSNGDLLWASGKNFALTTRGGRIIRTAGFDHDLSGYAPGPGVANASDWSRPRVLEWFVDLADRNLYSVAVKCDDTPVDTEIVTVLGKDIQTLRVDERCDADAAGWSFTNQYWVNPSTGFVWRSIQFVHPDQEPIEIVTLRPPES